MSRTINLPCDHSPKSVLMEKEAPWLMGRGGTAGTDWNVGLGAAGDRWGAAGVGRKAAGLGARAAGEGWALKAGWRPVNSWRRASKSTAFWPPPRASGD